MEVATLFESDTFDRENAVIPFKEFYPQIKDYFKRYCKENSITYDGDKEIIFKKTKIGFYLNFSPGIRRYFLCIYPKNIWSYPLKKDLEPAFNDTVDFFKAMPNNLKIDEVAFSKSSITDNIDITDWTFTTNPDVGINEITKLSGFRTIREIGSLIFDRKKGCSTRKLLIINAGGIINSHKLNKIKGKISPLFAESPETIVHSDITLETLLNRTDKSNLFVLFFGTQHKIDSCYVPYKQCFIENNIPSQFINEKMVEKILNWGFENLTFEILKKALEEDTISLDISVSTDVDGFLGLSDLGEFQNNKFFGISISFSGSGKTEDWLEIFSDIDYSIYYNNIRFGEGELTKLGKKIEALSNLEGKTIDIFVTSRWKTYDVGFLERFLSKLGIKIRKFFYIGHKTNRFLFSSLIKETIYLYKHPFIIWDNRVASFQTNSKMQLYGTMFPMYTELLNPWNEQKLDEKDLKMMLWLVKKRIYRIANFYTLKTPEPLALFDNVKGLAIKDIHGKLKISLHTII